MRLGLAEGCFDVEALAEFDQLRLDAATQYARMARETGRLRVSETECRDVLAATMDGSLWQRLVADYGWTEDRFAAWLGELWISMLVRPDAGPPTSGG